MQENDPEDGEKPIPRAPAGLKAAGKRFWQEVHQAHEFIRSPELVMLVEDAARTRDVMARLQKVVDTATTLRTPGSTKQDVAIPELSELRAYRAQFASLIKQLDLPGPEDEAETEERSGPMTRSEAGKIGAAARWALKTGCKP